MRSEESDTESLDTAVQTQNSEESPSRSRAERERERASASSRAALKPWRKETVRFGRVDGIFPRRAGPARICARDTTTVPKPPTNARAKCHLETRGPSLSLSRVSSRGALSSLKALASRWIRSSLTSLRTSTREAALRAIERPLQRDLVSLHFSRAGASPFRNGAAARLGREHRALVERVPHQSLRSRTPRLCVFFFRLEPFLFIQPFARLPFPSRALVVGKDAGPSSVPSACSRRARLGPRPEISRNCGF